MFYKVVESRDTWILGFLLNTVTWRDNIRRSQSFVYFLFLQYPLWIRFVSQKTHKSVGLTLIARPHWHTNTRSTMQGFWYACGDKHAQNPGDWDQLSASQEMRIPGEFYVSNRYALLEIPVVIRQFYQVLLCEELIRSVVYAGLNDIKFRSHVQHRVCQQSHCSAKITGN